VDAAVPEPIHPSGAQLELTHDDQRVMVVEVGGGLRSYTVDGADVLDGYGADELCTVARGQLLIPWPNRLRDGKYEWRGRELQLALTEPPRGNAIHGLIRWSNWTAEQRSEDSLVMSLILHPSEGYPFALSLRIQYDLGDNGLAVHTEATNIGREPCPFGAGAHPYLTVGSERIDGCTLTAPGTTWMETDQRMIPTGSRAVEGTQYDFRAPRQIGATELDTGYGELSRGGDGLALVRLEDPGTGRGASLWMDSSYPYVMLFTGDALPDERRRRRGLGVEPMTCAPNAFQTGEGLVTLDPGETFSGSWGIQPA
jgi:aldose 1-epimerase